MANLVREGLLCVRWQPSVQALRNRKVNVQKPRTPHFERAKVLALLKPQYPPQDTSIYQPPSLTCKKYEELERSLKRPENPLEKILAREMRQKFEKSKLVAFFHKNPIDGHDQFTAKILFKREQMDLEHYSKYTAKLALEGTRYEKALDLFITHNVFVLCEEPKVAKLLKITKKIPQFVLMAAIVEGKMLNVKQLAAYALYKDITQARAELVATLNAAGTELLSRINQPSNTLVSQLTELAKIKEGN